MDSGIGLQDINNPIERIGQEAIEAAGFQFRDEDTAYRQIEALGLSPANVTDIILTHADPDHAGGLSDWPSANVYVSIEEFDAIRRGSWRYRTQQFAHSPEWRPIAAQEHDWFGLPARPVPIGFDTDLLLVPLFGHTAGHCGVAVRQGEQWILHVGDAYYLRAELGVEEHPVSALAAARAEDDTQRRNTLNHLRRLLTEYPDTITMFGYHDLSEANVQKPT